MIEKLLRFLQKIVGNRILNKIINKLQYTSNFYEGKGWGSETVKQEIDQIAELLSNNEVKLCIDIGGNIGEYAEALLEKFPNIDVVIFEPAKVNIDKLSKLFNQKNVVIEPFAVSNKSDIAELFTNEFGSGLASLTKRRLDHFGIDFNKQESVDTIRFEDYWINKLNKKHIDICKLDIEGHELDALQGFGEVIHNVDIIQFEFGGCNIDTRTYFQDFWYFFKEHNFEIYRITPLGLRFIKEYKETDEFFSTTNYLARKKLYS